jgi:hypothetical protein
MSGDQLAIGIKRMLDPVLPEGFTAHAVNDVVCLGGKGSVAIFFDDLLETTEGRDASYLASRVVLALSAIQDDIAICLREPWPNLTRLPGRRRQPMPSAIASDGRIVAWFGDRNAPDLRLSPIELT